MKKREKHSWYRREPRSEKSRSVFSTAQRSKYCSTFPIFLEREHQETWTNLYTLNYPWYAWVAHIRESYRRGSGSIHKKINTSPACLCSWELVLHHLHCIDLSAVWCRHFAWINVCIRCTFICIHGFSPCELNINCLLLICTLSNA